MIGLQEYIINNKVSVIKLAEEIGIKPGTIWRWFNVNNVSEKYHDFLVSKFNVEKEYINKKVNNISTHQPKHKGFNDYKICGDYTEIYIIRKNGDKFTVLIDTEDLPKLIEKDYRWHINVERSMDWIYATTIHYEGEVGSKEQMSIKLHHFVLDIIDGSLVDHINHNTLDNRKSNMRITDINKNVKSRRGENRNSSTGVRNVNRSHSDDILWVQFMKNGTRYKWDFPASQFKEACEFAEKKRKELFGEFAGKGIKE